jgi:hypothetical protein
MPSICDFEVVVLGMTQPKPTRLREYDVHHTPGVNTLTQTDGAIGQAKYAPDSARKAVPSTCECYITSTPNQQFRIMFTNHAKSDACVAVFVDGEWIYSGLSYQPDHKVIYFSGRLIDETTIQEMRFVDLDTTCIPFPDEC